MNAYKYGLRSESMRKVKRILRHYKELLKTL